MPLPNSKEIWKKKNKTISPKQRYFLLIEKLFKHLSSTKNEVLVRNQFLLEVTF